MVALELVLLTCTIDAHEKRYMEINDIPGANLSTNIGELVVMVL